MHWNDLDSSDGHTHTESACEACCPSPGGALTQRLEALHNIQFTASLAPASNCCLVLIHIETRVS